MVNVAVISFLFRLQQPPILPVHYVLAYFIYGRIQLNSSLFFKWHLVFGLHQQVSVVEQPCMFSDGLRCD